MASVKHLAYGIWRITSKPLWSLVDLFTDYGNDASRVSGLSLELIREYNKSRPYGPRRIICNAPYKQLYFKPNGQVTACCVNGLDVVGQVPGESIGSIWNGEKLKAFRRRIENYELEGGCAGCKHQLEAGNFHAFTGRIFDDWRPLKTPGYPTEITFEVSNTCNLECIMCSGEYSSLIRKNREGLPDQPEAYDEDFFLEIKQFLPYLRTVRFIGGEPFLIRAYYPLMEYLIQNNPGCKIYIQTNATILNEAVKRIIRSKQVELSVSLDSLQPETYEAIRKNANFARVQQHLDFFAERSRNYGQVININFCLMNRNWRELPDMIAYCDRNRFSLNVIPVASPGVYALRIMDAITLEQVATYYDTAVLDTRDPHLLEVFQETLSYVRYLLLQAPALQQKRYGYTAIEPDVLLRQMQAGLGFPEDMPEPERTAVVQEIRTGIGELPEKKQQQILADILLELEFAAAQVMVSGLDLPERLAKTRVMIAEIKANQDFPGKY